MNVENEIQEIVMDPRTQFAIEWGMRLLGATVILIAGWLIGRWGDNRINRLHRLDATLRNFLGNLLKYAVMVVAIVTVLAQFGIQTASLLAVLGAAGLALGLALQGTLSNVAAGVMLLILRPFNVGDFINAGGLSGTVRSLGLFGTELATGDNVFTFVPNGMIWGKEIVNFNRYPIRQQDIKLAVDYTTDIGHVMQIAERLLAEDDRVIKDEKPPKVLVDSLGDGNATVIARFWAKREDYWQLRWDMNKKLKETLDREGVPLAKPPLAIEMRQHDLKEKAA